MDKTETLRMINDINARLRALFEKATKTKMTEFNIDLVREIVVNEQIMNEADDIRDENFFIHGEDSKNTVLRNSIITGLEVTKKLADRIANEANWIPHTGCFLNESSNSG